MCHPLPDPEADQRDANGRPGAASPTAAVATDPLVQVERAASQCIPEPGAMTGKYALARTREAPGSQGYSAPGCFDGASALSVRRACRMVWSIWAIQRSRSLKSN